MDMLILAQFIITFRVVVRFSTPTAPRLVDMACFWPMFLFSVFFALEVTAKIIIFGFERYWHRKPIKNPFDFFTVYPLIILAVLYITVPSLQHIAMARAIILFSAFRACRLFVYMEPFRRVFFMCTQLIPAYWKMTMILMIVYFCFAVIGRWMFGGIIYNTNPALAGSPYKEAGFCSLNFNDIGSSFATLFALMIVNNWYIVANGFLLASHSIWVSAYFVAFFVVCNLVVLNILVSLVIDVAQAWSEEKLENRGANDLGKDGHGQVAAALGAGRDKAEHMLRSLLEKEDELYAKEAKQKPKHARYDDGCETRTRKSNWSLTSETAVQHAESAPARAPTRTFSRYGSM